MSKSSDERLRTRLNRDPLALAEKITGKTLDDPITQNLGLSLALMHFQTVDNALRAAGDTSHLTSWEEYLQVLRLEGFTCVAELKIPLAATDQQHDYWQAHYHPEGLLVTVGSYGSAVNNAELHFNWRPAKQVPNPVYEHDTARGWKTLRFLPAVEIEPRYSGSLFNLTDGSVGLEAHLDIREAFRMNLRWFRENGSFVAPWQQTPYLYVLHYADSRELERVEGCAARDAEFDKRRKARILLLPEAVRTALGLSA